MKLRENICIGIEDRVITIMKCYANECEGLYTVVFEDAYCNTSVMVLTYEEVKKEVRGGYFDLTLIKNLK